MNNIKNADLPVTPLVNNHGHPFHTSHIAFENTPLTTGLSKREAFAMAAMQGELASQTNRHNVQYIHSSDRRMNDHKLMAKRCVTFADALLAELEK